jgi:hypothetical protein
MAFSCWVVLLEMPLEGKLVGFGLFVADRLFAVGRLD